MISKIKYIVAKSQVPYENMALEEYLLNTVDSDTCIMYLWQNKHTVVIGKNQNPWQECNVSRIEADNGYLVRRLSGGGAVFHDLQNLNFTFLVSNENYDVLKQTEVILKAVSSYGIEVERSGRNDLTVDGRKFSGNAFYKTATSSYHHGTILINVDMTALSKYLNVSTDKLMSKGVRSVVSRVANLQEICKDITVENIKERLIEAFSNVYGLIPEEISENDLDKNRIKELSDKFASWEWRLGKKFVFTNEFSGRFPWGGISVQLSIDSGIVKDACVFSDAMDVNFVNNLPAVLIGLPYSPQALANAVKFAFANASEFEQGFGASTSVAEDLFEFFANQTF